MLIKKFEIFLITIVLLFSGLTFAQDDPNIRDIRIIHWNDFHAHNLPYRITKKNDNGGDDIAYYIGGTSGMLGYVNKYRDANSLLLVAGDDFQGSPISSITKGRSQLELLNLYNLDVFTIGNHEFDYGQWNVDSVFASANFDVLAGNVYMNSLGRTLAKPYTIKEVNGVKIGIIGLTALDLLTLTIPKNVSDIRMINADSVITDGIKYLKSEKCNLIVLLTHTGVDVDKKFAAKYSADVDIIVGGHSHTPLYKPVMINDVGIVQAGSYARWMGLMDLKVDISKDTLVSFHDQLIETVFDSTMYDRAAEEKVETMVSAIQKDLLVKIGVLKVDWKKSYQEQSNLGEWEADVMRKVMKTDMAIINGGGIRKDLPKGDITIQDMWEINPFGNTIVTFNVTGAQLKEMFAHNIRNTVIELKELNASDLAIPSGMYIEFDPRLIKEGSNDFITKFLINGKPLDYKKIYSVATNNYIGAQLKKYFGDTAKEVKITDSNIVDRDVMIDAVREQKVIDQKAEFRIKDISKK